ncbi:hypothetical protein HZH68_008354 [Vespula germanica]|uniref:Uncharacterized protein n=1 Tax=Vespula germanica TaxID=30212 RepID=A0A834K5E7_VESGE|nr:hypothetical protein HZH68_008354 [Vespula germanica]
MSLQSFIKMLQAPLMSILMTHVEQSPTHVEIGAVVMSRPNRHGGSREIDVEEPGETDYRPAILGFRTDLEPTASPLAWPATMRIEALSALVAAGYNEHKLPPVESIISILSSCLIRLAGVALQTLERTFTDRAKRRDDNSREIVPSPIDNCSLNHTRVSWKIPLLRAGFECQQAAGCSGCKM